MLNPIKSYFLPLDSSLKSYLGDLSASLFKNALIICSEASFLTVEITTVLKSFTLLKVPQMLTFLNLTLLVLKNL